MAKINKAFDQIFEFSRNAKARALRRISYGPNIVNDSELSDPNSWSGAAWTVSGGTATFDGTGLTGNHYLSQNLSLDVDPDACYRVTVEVTAFTGQVPLIFMGASNNLSAGIYATGTYSYVNRFKDASDFVIYFGGQGGAGNAITISSLSVQEVIFDQEDGEWELFEHPHNVPRIEYDYLGNRLGLLVENSGTNLIPSSDCAAWGNSGTSKTNNTTTTLGVFTGATVPSSGGDWHRIQAGAAAVTSGTVYTVQFWFKYGTSGDVLLNLRDNAQSAESRVIGSKGNLRVQYQNIGTINADTIVETQLPDDVMHVSFQWTPNYTGDVVLGIGPRSSSSTKTVIGLAGALEDRDWVSSYIKTAGSTVTKSYDNCGLSTDQFSYDPKRLTIMVSAIHRHAHNYQSSRYGRLFSVDAKFETYNAGNQTGYIRYRAQNQSGTNIFIDNLTESGGMRAGTRVAMSARNKQQSIAKDGHAPDNGTAEDINVDLDFLRVGSEGVGSNLFQGHIRDIKVYPEALTPDQLVEITRPDDAATLSLTFNGESDSYVGMYING